MPYKEIEKYTTVMILKKVRDRVRNYAEVSGKPLNTIITEILMDAVEHQPVDKYCKGYIPRVY
jgi:predicted HicB family RNase H-like nuclease